MVFETRVRLSEKNEHGSAKKHKNFLAKKSKFLENQKNGF
jgi:hypothetical protein